MDFLNLTWWLSFSSSVSPEVLPRPGVLCISWVMMLSLPSPNGFLVEMPSRILPRMLSRSANWSPETFKDDLWFLFLRFCGPFMVAPAWPNLAVLAPTYICKWWGLCGLLVTISADIFKFLNWFAGVSNFRKSVLELGSESSLSGVWRFGFLLNHSVCSFGLSLSLASALCLYLN